jgi:hypothetical protein
LNSSAAAGKVYLENYPKYRKWMSQCVACNRQGYRPGTIHPLLLRYFEPLELNDAGLCPHCSGE